MQKPSYWLIALGTLAGTGCAATNSKHDEGTSRANEPADTTNGDVTSADATNADTTSGNALASQPAVTNESEPGESSEQSPAADSSATPSRASLHPPPACATVPCISRSHAVYDSGRFSVAFSGWGSADEVDAVILKLPSDDSASVGWRQFSSSLRFREGGSHGSLHAFEDGSFAGYLSIGHEGAPDSATLELVDYARQERSSVDVLTGTKGVQDVGAGALCDLGALLYRCTEGLLCDTTDHTQGTVCRPPATECATPADVPPLTLAGALGNVDHLEAEDFTLGSCSRQRGDLGADNRFRFVPSAAGTYRFTFLGAAVTLFVRRLCDFPDPAHSELGCVSTLTPAPGAEDTASLLVELEADSPYFVFVEGGWASGGPYALNVEKLP